MDKRQLKPRKPGVVEDLKNMQKDIKAFRTLFKERYRLGRYRSYALLKFQEIVDTLEKQIKRSSDLYLEKEKLERELARINKSIDEAEDLEEFIEELEKVDETIAFNENQFDNQTIESRD